MIEEREIADIVQLFARLGDSLAIDVLLDDAKEAVADGRRDLATHLLDLSERFFGLRLEAGGNANQETEALRTMGVSLRVVAHRLHKACGEAADDPRLLRLVHSSGE